MTGSAATTARRTLLRMKVLVIDPITHLRSRLVERLADAGLDVVEAGDAATAVAALERHPIDAVVLDVPDRHSLELLADVRRGAPSATVVVITNSLWYRRRCLDLGADHFLDKSRDLERVVEVLEVLERQLPATAGRTPRA